MVDGELFKQLELELGPDAASLEYYAAMAHDERLMALLEIEPQKITINAQRLTTEIPASQLFEPNDTQVTTLQIDEDVIRGELIEEVRVPALFFSIKGSIVFEPSQLVTDIAVTPIESPGLTVQIQNIGMTDDEFIVYRSNAEGFVSEVTNTEGLLYLLGSLANIAPSLLKHSLLLNEPSDKKLTKHDYRQHIQTLWRRIGEAGESARTTRTLTVPVETPASPDVKEVLRLTYEDIESESDSIIRLTIEKVKQYTQLDTEEIYLLQLSLRPVPEKTLEEVAERHISSGIRPLSLIGAHGTHKPQQGRTTTLDINDPAVRVQFVDWFDQIVAA